MNISKTCSSASTRNEFILGLMCWGTSVRVSSVARPQVLVLGWYFPWHGAAAAAAEQIWVSATGICFPAFVLLAAFCAHCILSESTEQIWLPKCLAGKIGHKNQLNPGMSLGLRHTNGESSTEPSQPWWTLSQSSSQRKTPRKLLWARPCQRELL